ncbi:MAG: STAS domain-containing protein [Candidatus Peregrinibacteria bacterium]
MEELKISIEPSSDLSNTHVAYFDGDFDGGAATSLTDLQSFVDNATPKTKLILEFSKLNFLNSYAIGHLVAWHQHLTSLGGEVVIVGTNKNVEDIFAIVGISKLFKIFPDLSTAIADFKNA